MSAYDYDRRVEKVNNGAYRVAADDKYDVMESWTKPGQWYITPSLDSRDTREANLRTHAQREAYAARTTRGPYSSRDAAIAELLGG